MRRFMCSLIILSMFAAVPCASPAVSGAPKKNDLARTWTIMFYLNGSVELESSVRCALQQLLFVEPSAQVQLVGEVALTGDVDTSPDKPTSVPLDCGDGLKPALTWTGIRRFAITAKHGLAPALGIPLPGRTEIRRPETLTAFVRWAVTRYKAQHYILILADHGADTPYVANSAPPGDLFSSSVTDRSEVAISPMHVAHIKPPRQSDIMSNLEIQKALRDGLGRSKLEVLGFDSCYKAMLETAYAMQDVAHILVASETTETSVNWDYSIWPSSISKSPGRNRWEIAQDIMDGFRAKHDPSGVASLSAIDLDMLPAILDPLDLLSNSLGSDDQLLAGARTARETCQPALSYDIDLGCFVLALLGSPDLSHSGRKSLITGLAQRVNSAVGAAGSSFQTDDARDRYHASGIAIYFPGSIETFCEDAKHELYDPKNRHAIPFAKRHLWSHFLMTYLGIPPAACH